MGSRVRLSGVTFRYPRAKATALSDVSFEVGPGITGLVGLNGAGKSTLLNILATVHRPSSGSITWTNDGSQFLSRRQMRTQVSLMPQSVVLPRSFTAAGFLQYGGWLQGLTARQASTRAENLLDTVDLAGQAGVRCTQLSGGQQRRLVFANALAKRPGLLLLDEPTTGLDPQQRLIMRETIRAAAVDCCVIMSSHLLEDVMSLATHLVVLSSGRTVFCGPAEQLETLLAGQGEEGFVRFLSKGSV